jgi:hypothetical protein
MDDVPANHVSTVNPTSVLLSFITIRRPVESALDVGTGCGVQALLAARHARRVVATDINPRALNVTAFNARLNGLDNVECRQGSYFEPVAGETFDLVATNPPFVISPEARYIFRDGSQSGDAVTAQVARQLPAFLREGGLGHMLGNWVCAPGGDWTEPPRRWLDGSGCDVLALLHSFDDPLAYAGRWLRGEYLSSPAAFGPALDRWLEYYRGHGIQALASGGLILRRRAGGANWFQGYQAASQTQEPCGDLLARLFRIQDYCLEHLRSPDALLGCRLRLQEGHLLDQAFQYKQGKYHLQASHLRLNEGLSFRSGVDGFGVELLTRCDGSRTLRQALEEMAGKYQLRPEELIPAPEELIPATLASVQNLLIRGLLVPGDLEG